MSDYAMRFGWSPGKAGIINPQRLTAMAPLLQTVALPACVVAWIAAFGSPGLEHQGMTPFINHFAPSLAADAPALAANAEFAVKPQSIAMEKPQAIAADMPQADAAETTSPTLAAVAADDMAADKSAADTPHAATISNTDIATANEPMKAIASEPVKETTITETASASQETAAPAASHDQEPIVTAALTDPSDKLPSETPPVQAAIVSSAGPATVDATQPLGTVENLDECYVMEACIDRYLFALYQRTRKEDAVKQEDRRQVIVKRKGKMVTVARTFTTVVDEDFGWKDPKAAEKAGMSMPDYVFGGMDATFKLKLFHMLLAAEQAGLSPGITSGFRDDYRQSIASGLKAASDRSYHGGSFRGGYGHGLAADVVSTRGDTRAARQASSEIFWKWIDTHGQEFGVARPYQDRDPPHVAPIDGLEYATHFRGKKTKTAGTDAKKPAPEHHGETKRQNSQRSSRSKNT